MHETKHARSHSNTSGRPLIQLHDRNLACRFAISLWECSGWPAFVSTNTLPTFIARLRSQLNLRTAVMAVLAFYIVMALASSTLAFPGAGISKPAEKYCIQEYDCTSRGAFQCCSNTMSIGNIKTAGCSTRKLPRLARLLVA